MTIVVWDGVTLAADKMADFDGVRLTVTKISRLSDGSLMGTCGDGGLGEALKRWLEKGIAEGGEPSDPYPDAEAECNLLHVRTDGTVALYCGTGAPMLVEGQRFAMGSGRDFALSAMHFGQDARGAVGFACEHSLSCGVGVDVLTLADKPAPVKAPGFDGGDGGADSVTAAYRRAGLLLPVVDLPPERWALEDKHPEFTGAQRFERMARDGRRDGA